MSKFITLNHLFTEYYAYPLNATILNKNLKLHNVKCQSREKKIVKFELRYFCICVNGRYASGFRG